MRCIRNGLRVTLTFVAGLALAAPRATAQSVYDLGNDWSDASNPDGPWSCNAGASTLAVHQSSWLPGTFVQPQPAWADADHAFGHIPAWMKLVTDFSPALDTLPGDVIMHANDPFNGTDVDLANVTWTCPATGSVTVDGALWMIRHIGRSLDWRLYQNASLLLSGSLTNVDGYDRAYPDAFGLPLNVTAGDVLRLEFQRTSSAGDFCGVRFKISYCGTPASYANYDAGWPGTNGVPGLTLEADPVLGGPVAIEIGNSRAADTSGLLLVGLAKESVPTALGGTLLVDPFLWLPIAIPAAGGTLNGTAPNDPGLCGVSIFLQVLEFDAGASRRVSFTPGLEMDLGG